MFGMQNKLLAVSYTRCLVYEDQLYLLVFNVPNTCIICNNYILALKSVNLIGISEEIRDKRFLPKKKLLSNICEYSPCLLFDALVLFVL